MSATTTDRSEEGHAEAAGSVESHIGSPTPSLVVLHPGAPQRHSQIRRSRPNVRTGPAGSAFTPKTAVCAPCASVVVRGQLCDLAPRMAPGFAILILRSIDPGKSTVCVRDIRVGDSRQTVTACRRRHGPVTVTVAVKRACAAGQRTECVGGVDLTDHSSPLASGLRPQVAAALPSRPAPPNARPACRPPRDRCARAQPRTWLAPESSTHGSAHRGRCRST